MCASPHISYSLIKSPSPDTLFMNMEETVIIKLGSNMDN